MIVVDTTVWIDFLEAKGTAFDRHLAELIERDAPIALVDIIYCEILQGIHDADTYNRTRLLLLAHPILPPGVSRPSRPPPICIGRRGVRGSRSGRSVDCVIAATCLEARAEIYHNDRDLDALARVSDLTI